MTEVFLSSTPATSTRSALFVAWGQLLTYDMHLNVDNSSEPFTVPCNDGVGGTVDVWCPEGAASEDISFFRSDAELAAGSDYGSGSVRNPVNYATAYIDLDFVYGRSEAEAEALRTMEGGLMNITASGVPFREADGTWLVSRPCVCVVSFFLCACALSLRRGGEALEQHLGRRVLIDKSRG